MGILQVAAVQTLILVQVTGLEVSATGSKLTIGHYASALFHSRVYQTTNHTFAWIQLVPYPVAKKDTTKK